MGIRNAYDVRYTPRGLSDSSDGTDVFPGAAQKLSNLIFSQADPEMMIARPGVPFISEFPGFSDPMVVSVAIAMGQYVIGMIGSSLHTGKDEPFVYDVAGGVFIPVSGTGSAADLPSTQSTAGAWEPPTMTVVGTHVVITHPGYAATAHFVGFIDIANIAAPAYSAGNTATNALSQRPTSVATYNGRAWYACGKTEEYSDVLDPGTRTSGTQAIVIGDPSPITGQSGLPVQTTTSGVVGALLVWKATQIWQIVEGPVGTFSLNFVSLTVGTVAPRTIYPCPDGTYFLGPDSVYLVNLYAQVVTLRHGDGAMEPDVKVPFQNATNPTRACAAYNAGVFRLCLDTINRQGNNVAGADYWFDSKRRRWNGPHTFGYDCIVPMGNYFILFSNAAPGKMFKSEVYPTLSSVYLDNGAPYNCNELTCMLPKTKGLSQKQVVESSIEVSNPGTAATYFINAVDELGAILASATIQSFGSSGAQWGAVTWGSFLWGSSLQVPGVYTIPWNQAVNFQKMGLDITVTAGSGVMIGTNYHGYQNLGYRNARLPNM